MSNKDINDERDKRVTTRSFAVTAATIVTVVEKCEIVTTLSGNALSNRPNTNNEDSHQL